MSELRRLSGDSRASCADGVHVFDTVALCRCKRQGNGPQWAEGREGMVTVYDHFGRYVGCMGEETWRGRSGGSGRDVLVFLDRLNALESENRRLVEARLRDENVIISQGRKLEDVVAALKEIAATDPSDCDWRDVAQTYERIAAEALSRVSRSEPAPLDEREERRRKWAYGAGPDTLNG